MKEHQSSPPEAGPAAEADPVWRAFIDPPDEARPRAWWHWMDGNVDPAGIVRDLRWLHDVGVRGVQVFDGGMGGPLVVPAPVRPGSEAWDEAVDTAKRTASELGMELAVATSSGWSAAGGPWVEPADAMKKVVWSESVVSGGGIVEVVLAAPAGGAGPRTRTARAGAPRRTPTATSRTGACSRSPPTRRTRRWQPDAVRASAPIDDWSCLTDGSFGRTLALPRDPDGWSTAWIEQEFADPVTVRSVVVGLPGPARIRRGAAGIRRPAGERRRRRVPGCRGTAGRRHPGPHRELPRRHRATVPPRAVGGERGGRAPAGGGRRAPPSGAPHGRHLRGLGVRPSRGRARPSRRGQGRLRGRGRLLRRADRPASRRGVGGSDHRRRRHRPGARRRAALGRARGRLDRPAPRRVAHRADERSRAGGRDGPRGRQARRGARSRVPRHAPPPVRDRRRRRLAHLRSPLRRTAQRQHRGRPAELDGGDPRPLRTPARLRRGAVASRPRRIPGGGPFGVRPVPVRLPAHDRRAPRRRVLRHARGGGASARHGVLRGGARGRTTAARRRPRHALARRRADGRDVDVRCRARPAADLRRRPEGRVVRRARAREGLGRGGGVHVVRPAVGVHAAHAQARRRPAARPRRHAVLHPHLAAPADRRSPARHRPRAVPRPGVHDQRDVVGPRPPVDRLPRALLGAAQHGHAGGRRRGLRRRGGAR